MSQRRVSKPNDLTADTRMLRRFWDGEWNRGAEVCTTWPGIASGFFDMKNIRSVLDVGCGDMRFEIFSGSNRRVVGVDISPVALERARERMRVREAKGFEFVLASADKLPFAEGSFDLVMAMDTMPLLGGSYTKALAEMARVSCGLVVFNAVHSENAGGRIEFGGKTLEALTFSEEEVTASIRAAGLTMTLLRTFTGNEIDNWGAPPYAWHEFPEGEKKAAILAVARKQA
jgi:SAM-dependent methyltransferase